MRKYAVVIFIFSVLSNIGFCQDGQLIVNGEYDNTPFPLFVNDIESQVPVQFLYHPQIVDSFFVTANFNNIPLKQALRRVFNDTEVYFFINDYDQVILTQGYEVEGRFHGLGFRV